jgi:carbon monoxide dehydrogenase subunit G
VEFENGFTVQAPVDEVYDALLDVERVAPAMPGASVLEKVDDDTYKVAIKVKLGPVSMTYRGDVSVVERDPSAHTAVLDVKAKETRGQGSANATVRLALSSDGDATKGTMNTAVQLSGKAAAMSRGVIDDVSKRLVAQFAENLEGIVTESPAESAAAANDESEAPAMPKTFHEPEGQSSPPEPEAFDAGSLAASMAADRLRDPKVVGAVVGGVLLVGILIGRRS